MIARNRIHGRTKNYNKNGVILHHRFHGVLGIRSFFFFFCKKHNIYLHVSRTYIGAMLAYKPYIT